MCIRDRDNTLIKTDRYEEIPEENIITNSIKTYETQTGKQYKVELVIKIKDREYVISELEYNTQDSEEIKGIYNKEDFLEIQPRGHYIVLGDIDIGEENYAFGNGSLFFEGTINFNGYKLILKDSINHLIKNISTSGGIENIVIDAYMTKSSFQALIESNYGTIRNLQFNIISVSYTHLDVYKRQSMYNEETGQYEIYNEEELLDTTKEEVVSENEKRCV